MPTTEPFIEPQHYLVRSMKELSAGMHIRWVTPQRWFDYIVVDVSRKAKCAVVIKANDSRKHPNKMVLKNLHLFIKRGVILAEE